VVLQGWAARVTTLMNMRIMSDDSEADEVLFLGWE